MNIRKTALVMVFWLLCQQAVAVMSVFPLDAMSDGQGSTHCHDKHSDTSTPGKKDSNVDPMMGGCDIECQCCVSSCQPVVVGALNQLTPYLPTRLVDHYSFTLSQTPPSSLFRPPITA